MFGTLEKQREIEGGLGKVVLAFKKIFGTEMVDLYVGPNNEHFSVHKEALCGKVQYFDKMFNGGFSEARKSTATFPEDNAKIFDLLLKWIYLGDLKAPQIVAPKAEGELMTLSWQPFKLHKLGEKLCIHDLQDKVVDISRKVDRKTVLLSIAFAFLRKGLDLNQSCGLHKYLAHCLDFMILEAKISDAYLIDGDTGIADATVKDIGLTRDALNILKASGGKFQNPLDLPDCHFHYHAEGGPCYKDKWPIQSQNNALDTVR